jgi:hypothetical protein
VSDLRSENRTVEKAASRRADVAPKSRVPFVKPEIEPLGQLTLRTFGTIPGGF